jgi:outer membrane lipoprotein-sorting protein
VRISAGKLPSSEQILQKYIAALGGVKAIQGMTTLVGNGTATDSAGRRFPFEICAKPPDKRLLIRHQPGRDVPLGYNGNYGWLMDIAGDFRFMRSEELDEYKLEDIFYFPMRLREMVSPLRVEGIAKISGRDSYVVSGRTRILPLVKLYFDKESGLLVRVLEHIDSAAGPYPTQVDITDYRNAGGLRIPFRWTLGQINVEGGPITYQVDHVQENVPVADSKFNKPGARAAEPPKSGSQHGN